MQQGKFFWRDAMTPDVAAAGAFYSKAVGWGLQEIPSPGQPYTLLTIEGHGVAGLMSPPDTVKDRSQAFWSIYVCVDDVDAMAAKIEAAGGAIHRPPTDVPGVIRFCVVADPQGAVFIIAKPYPVQPQAEFPPGTPGTVGWHELYADDWENAFAFYEAMFGWTKAEAHDMGPMGVYQLFVTGGGEPAGGMMTKPPQISSPFWGLYFNVEAIDAAAERVKAEGGQVIMGPMQVPGGDWIAQCHDNQGAYFAMTSRQR